ncbi:hypothetical protein [Sporomusa sphaeroides]|uniref:Uncharacterized protein n=1 Tax=Sporomusa sphaeroides DSM 2875 TaxID=1337886 RepID=A0A1U7MA75_9FIRM|nr:hypothetical protein [Sporomusa sphaeroides]OLS54336.1 hypothetical protein SPSPH_45820 [Sporomusa sphaeroides DSM 2875]CVK21565.1 hypothetical protein SSPH_04257 [Sporomusa sphaeroides DSM 2875]
MRDEEKNWGGSREGAGRVSVIERKNFYYRLSEAEHVIDKQVISAFKKVETELIKELAKARKCKQYEVVEDVHRQMLQAREKIMDAAKEAIMLEKNVIKDRLLNSSFEKVSDTH